MLPDLSQFHSVLISRVQPAVRLPSRIIPAAADRLKLRRLSAPMQCKANGLAFTRLRHGGRAGSWLRSGTCRSGVAVPISVTVGTFALIAIGASTAVFKGVIAGAFFGVAEVVVHALVVLVTVG